MMQITIERDHSYQAILQTTSPVQPFQVGQQIVVFLYQMHPPVVIHIQHFIIELFESLPAWDDTNKCIEESKGHRPMLPCLDQSSLLIVYCNEISNDLERS